MDTSWNATLNRFLRLGVGALFVFWLWNVIMVPKFGLPSFNYWESLGVLVMCRQLFPPQSALKGQDNGK